MNKHRAAVVYHPLEEQLNVISHAVGMLLGMVATFLLIRRAALIGDGYHLASFIVFGVSLITLYAASTFYHWVQHVDWRHRLRILDHAAIYVLIAGTYTPFALVTLNGTLGWVIFGIVWGMALVGIVLKIFFTGRYIKLSTAMYIGMGWLIVIFLRPLMHNLAPEGLLWLLIGGLSYSAGAVFFSIKRIRFNHAIFHGFVLLGSICHFLAVYYYVLPGH